VTRASQTSANAKIKVYRRSLIVLAIVVTGGILGWVSYWTQPPRWILGTCTGTVSGFGGMAAKPCTPPINVEVPLDIGGAISWAVLGALLALAVGGLVAWLAIELRERRGSRRVQSEPPSG
jgi:hypothetical protein